MHTNWAILVKNTLLKLWLMPATASYNAIGRPIVVRSTLSLTIGTPWSLSKSRLAEVPGMGAHWNRLLLISCGVSNDAYWSINKRFILNTRIHLYEPTLW